MGCAPSAQDGVVLGRAIALLLRWWRWPAYNADAMRVEARVEVEESGEPAKRRGGEPAQKVQDLHEPQQVRCGCVAVHWSLSHSGLRRHHGSPALAPRCLSVLGRWKLFLFSLFLATL